VADIVRTRRAKADFLRIWRFIARDSEIAATRLLEQFDRRIRQLAIFPESGSPHDDVRPGLRMLVVSGYRVLYRFDVARDLVEIVAVVEPYRE